ncbi:MULTISPECIES: DUF6685 family protein [Enterobacter cloacae complex]|uniref:DUF6685 family protein n=1 Tax=Enterobacter cloacae complex TaxID=354276 RepID=UPI00290099A0|nr:DUF6685 family protein [Enterobacter hormaechei]MDU2249685.1 DUF6685 family protein [Enterobacter hormaechei]
MNDGGSHHFGAARYQARRLGIAVPLTGTLCRYSVNVQMISVLRNKWHLLVIPKDELFGIFFMPWRHLNARLVVPIYRPACMMRTNLVLR